ncbi:MAG: hypothetical protein PHC75_05175 [Burkholderiales bacterium]|nr:hypothetical protein [Burkholderiales bacterium]
MFKIPKSKKDIADSLDLYIKNHNDKSQQLITQLSEDLCNTTIKHSLIDYDRSLLINIIKISLTYCIATYKLNRYPKFINATTGLNLIIASLINGLLKFNQRNSLSSYMNTLLNEIQYLLQNGQTYEKIETITHIFKIEFDIVYFYELILMF